MRYYDMVEEAWKLSDTVRAYVVDAGREVEVSEVWEKILSASPLVDRARTEREGGTPLSRVFFNNPYGLVYLPERKDWVPFRHGPIDLGKEPE